MIEARPVIRAPRRAGVCAVVAARPGLRGGFTLVEVLMVILIISMLIALLLPAVQAAKLSAIKTSIKMDVDQLTIALNGFKDKYGSYPPDRNWSSDEIGTFLRRAFPRATFTTNDLNIIKSLNEAESLVFWLGGIFDGTKMTGFCMDPKNPFAPPDQQHDPFGKFVNATQSSQRTTPYGFAETRLADHDTTTTNQQTGAIFPEYFPPNINIDQSPPYAYFAARPNGKYFSDIAYSGAQPPLSRYQCLTIPTIAVPYFRHINTSNRANSDFVKPTEFQIICAGVDNDYGAFADKEFPYGTGYNSLDNDNIASFTAKTIGDAQP